MLRLLLVLGSATLTTLATAQTVVIPNGTATTEGTGGNLFPWGRGANGIRIQYLYDSFNFTTQGVASPIVISRLRWRPNTNTLTLASNYATGGTVKLSTSPIDQAAISTTLSNNQGGDLLTVFSGPVSWPAAAATPGPCPFLIDIPLATNFYYDPARGDLNIETELPVQTFTGTTLSLDHAGNATTAPASRAYVTAGYTNGGSNDVGLVTLNSGAVVEVTYAPATGLYPRFVADVTRGSTPLSVNFTDQSWTSAASGITSWAWDFNGDNVIDSNLQNPTFVYTGCGDFNVSLTVGDGTNPAATWTAPAYVKTDEIVVDFSAVFFLTPSLYQFTDLTTPPATAWAWDFNGDNVIDSTQQNPIWLMPSCVSTNVRLTATRSCRTASLTKPIVASPGSLVVTSTGSGQMLSGQGFFFDLNVTNPQGISICALSQRVSSAPSPFSAFLYVTPGTYLGKETNAAIWRLAGTATGPGPSVLGPVVSPFAIPVYLPMGTYGVALYYSAATFPGYQSVAANPISNPDVTLTNGPGRSTLFGGTALMNRLWIGTIHYDTAALGAASGFGFFGAGCAGTLPISNLQTTTRPQLGTTMTVNLNNLPLSLAIMVMGIDNTSSVFGPLPLNLMPYGAPSCFAHVRPDATRVLIGSGNTATWSLSIPNDIGLAGLLFFNQAFVVDPPVNMLGAVMSDAAAMLIGF